MDMALTEQVIANAKFAKNAVVELTPAHDSGSLLWEFFHLRPTETGVAIVSNHPRYPMYFADTEKDALKAKLQGLERDALPLLSRGVLNGEEIAALAEVIEAAGFVQGPLEPMKVAMRQTPEHLQALFISGMIHGGADMEGCIGIGHTRWATHGEPSRANAHTSTVMTKHQMMRCAITSSGLTSSSSFQYSGNIPHSA